MTATSARHVVCVGPCIMECWLVSHQQNALDGAYLLLDALRRMSERERRAFLRKRPTRELLELLCPGARPRRSGRIHLTRV